MSDDWTFGDLTPLAYDFIMVDAPWTFKLRSSKGEKKSPQAQYSCMSLDDIKALPVGKLAAKDCMLFCWATAPMINQALDAVRAWGFTYKSMGFWHKRTSGGKTAFGTGYVVRSAAEPFLLATIGNPPTSRRHRNLIEGLAREHSRKPEEAYQWCETYAPNARRVELFARQSRPGWACWGDQKELFDKVAA